jgi:hypothetical protein
MIDNPISNPGASPIGPTPPYGPSNPRLGAGEEAQEPKPFSLGPEGSPVTAQPQSTRPSPMEIAGDTAHKQAPMAHEELTDQIAKLQNKLGNIHDQLQNPAVTQKFGDDHLKAMQMMTQKMNPDMQNIAKNTNGQYSPPDQASGQGVVSYISQWLNGAQGTLGGALDYLQNTEKPDVTSYLKLQYSIQRASQRGELFASIIGSTVSGIKTIMSTQLG